MIHFPPCLRLQPTSIAPLAMAWVFSGCQGGEPTEQPLDPAGGATTDGTIGVGVGTQASATGASATTAPMTASGVGGGAQAVAAVTGGSPDGSTNAANGVGGAASAVVTGGTPSSSTVSGSTTDATTTGGACPAGAVQCPDRCANLSTDFYNCGACGSPCAEGQSCVAGVCTCGIGQENCGSVCVDVSTSLEHCGACDNTCAADMVCSGGVCGTGCLAQYTKCTEGCRDTTSDAANCGACGNACGATQVCRNGTCGCGSSQMLCDDVCRDVQTDTQNCGACGNACQGSEWCADGFCLDETTLDCGGTRAGETCENYSRDVYNQYYVFNNLWGAEENNVSGTQCVWNNCVAGDLIGWGTEWNWPSTSGVKSYTCAILGWHWGWVVPQEKTILPVQLNSGETVTCGWNFSLTASGDFTVAYDLWTHTSANAQQEDPSNEIMIWLNKSGNVAPLGSVQATVNIGGASWDLWRGPGGSTWEVFSFVRTTNTTNAVLNMTDFTGDLVQRGWIPGSQYLVSIEAGPEVSGGTGVLDTHGFYCRKQ